MARAQKGASQAPRMIPAQTYVLPDVYEEMCELARLEDRPVASFMRICLLDGLERRRRDAHKFVAPSLSKR